MQRTKITLIQRSSIIPWSKEEVRANVDLQRFSDGFAEFERTFGLLDQNSRTNYAVRDFLNDRKNAVMVRLYNGNQTAGTA